MTGRTATTTLLSKFLDAANAGGGSEEELEYRLNLRKAEESLEWQRRDLVDTLAHLDRQALDTRDYFKRKAREFNDVCEDVNLRLVGYKRVRKEILENIHALGEWALTATSSEGHTDVNLPGLEEVRRAAFARELPLERPSIEKVRKEAGNPDVAGVAWRDDLDQVPRKQLASRARSECASESSAEL